MRFFDTLISHTTCTPIVSQVPVLPPHILRPCYDLEVLKKVGVTIDKVSAYLDKAGAVEWWKGWIKDANTWTGPQNPEPLNGMEYISA